MTIDWPDEFDRTPSDKREPYPHGFRVSRSESFDNILSELRMMDARNVQFDTGAQHQKRNPNKPYANSQFDDPGVVVRFERNGQQFAIPCDRWDNPRDNGQAIAKYLNAKRALERYGVSTIESEYSTHALPPGDESGGAIVARQPPHEILGVAPDAPKSVVKGAARSLKKDTHPDNGGDESRFKRVVKAEQALLDQ